MSLPQLIKLSAFYCLKETPLHSNGKGILFLHGLGENRSGINYLFKELSTALTTIGYTTYRFDLGGCGDSPLSLSLSTWREQVDLLLKQVSIIIARGLSTVLLPIAGKKSIALRSFSKELFLQKFPKIPAKREKGQWIPDGRHKMDIEEENFYFNLGVEASCVGGFSLPFTLIKEIEALPKTEDPIILHPPNCHPLFLLQKDRELLLEKILEVL